MSLKKLVNTFYDVREGEWKQAFLMFGLHFLLMVILYFLKPARDSLFLTEIGPRQLPFVYIILAVVSVPVTQLVSRIIQKKSIRSVISGTIWFLILNLILLRWLFVVESSWIYLVFYVWVGIFGILVISQYWLLANGLFNAAQSKRLFALLNLGAITGAIAGSELSSLLVSRLGLSTESLVLLAAIMLLFCIVLIQYIPLDSDGTIEKRSVSRNIDQAPSDIFKTVYKSRYQMIIAGIIGITMLVSTLVDYQFKSIATDAFPDTAALTSFMGTFYGGLSLASLLIQILLSSQIIRKLGLAGAVMSRPVGMLAGGILLAVEPVLASAIFLRGYDGATRYSIDKTGRELLFLPLSQKMKKKTKIFLDIFVDRFFRGIAGFILLVFVFWADISVQQISYFVIFFVACWLLLAYRAKIAYVSKFRSSLSKRYIDSDHVAFDLNESSVFRSVREALHSDNPSQVLYTLSLLSSKDMVKLIDDLRWLLNHPAGEIRSKVVELLQKLDDVHLVDEVKQLLNDENPEVRLEAIYYLCRHSEDDPDQVIQRYLNDEDNKLKSAALGCVARHGSGQVVKLIEKGYLDRILELEKEDGEVIRAQISQTLGHIESGELTRKYLTRLLEDRSPLVVRETIKSMQKTGDKRFVPILLEKMKDTEYAIEAQKGLAAFGIECLPLFKKRFFDDSVSMDLRRRIPGIIHRIPRQESVEHLLDMLETDNPQLRYHVLKALDKLKKYHSELEFDEQRIRKYLQREAKEYFTLLAIKLVQRDDIPNNILIRALEEKMDQTVERIFRTLGLLYDLMDMYGAYLGWQSVDRENRAASIEFLDNVLKQTDSPYVFPVVDDLPEPQKLKKGRELFDIDIHSYQEGISRLLDGDDIWLRTCAIFSVSSTCPLVLQEKVRGALNDPNDLIRETAGYVINRFEN